MRFKTLKQTKNPEEYDLYRASLEWSLDDPIVIEDINDLKSEYLWRNRVEPYHHQVTNLITFCRRLPVTLLADDVGLGKTISAGLIASELISRNRVSKILIICPKIIREQWKEELETKFEIPSIIVTGGELMHAIPPGEAGAVITTYETARLYLSSIHKVGYDMLVLDEAHKLRNLYGVDPAPQVAVKFRKALSDRMFKYVLMLTATPIQNRLWDLYSLVDLLSVARGHENPFGGEGMFARKFIADNRQQARHLNPESQDDFRAVVYSYMSRVRRDDADLHFPKRIVQTHRVDPTTEEIELINIISEPIEKFNRLAQISILQALVSSPHALSSQLNSMARKGTAPVELATAVAEVVKRIHITSKLKGVAALIEELRKRQGEKWRMVLFTTRRETQTTIENYLNSIGIKVGLINGDSGARNQDTILKFKQDTPEINVIISTEAGSQGVNLQSANVLVNYDLPWNPMIIEQRIGRVQRLASKFENVTIFNVVLKDTFEEYIVGRLMEKLQMASSAIGDIEALLEATDEDESDSGGFEEKIRHLVVESLKGKNIEKATKQAEESILQAKIRLEQEERNINSLLGSMDGKGYKGPRNPRLPKQTRLMSFRDYSLKVIGYLNDRIKPVNDLQYAYTHNNRTEYFHFEDETPSNPEIRSTVLRQGTSLFERIVEQTSALDLHLVIDEDLNVVEKSQNISTSWVNSFDAIFLSCKISDVSREFEGVALIRVKATVACDSYERLIEVECFPEENHNYGGPEGIEPIGVLIDNPTAIGINVQKVENKAKQDEGIVEFCRFYNERRVLELEAAGDDERKRKRIEDEFTPRLEIILVGLKGSIKRLVKVLTSYSIDDNKYSSEVSVFPANQTMQDAPDIRTCQETGKRVPDNCLKKCAISGFDVLSHLLLQSEKSKRLALARYTSICALSGKRLLSDEVEKSDVTGEMVDRALLVTSALSGKRAEPKYCGVCAFSSSTVLLSELQNSQVSGKPYRIDQQLRSVVSSKCGHKDEFIYCFLTNQPLLSIETERCEASGKLVMPGTLDKCEVSGMKVLPSLLKKSVLSGKKALSKYFVVSSISSAICLEDEAVKSVTGKYCLPIEAKECTWSGVQCHPEDISICGYTMIQVHLQYLTHSLPYRLQVLDNLLQGVDRSIDKIEVWSAIENQSKRLVDANRCKVINSIVSPKEEIVASVIEIRTWGGLKVRYAGILYSISKDNIIGRYVIGKRDSKGWFKTDS